MYIKVKNGSDLIKLGDIMSSWKIFRKSRRSDGRSRKLLGMSNEEDIENLNYSDAVIRE